MTTISELFGRSITPEAKLCHTPRSEILSARIRAKSEKAPDKFEAEVFNFLLDNNEELGIKNVMKFSALVVDGAVELKDGKRLTIEIKFRMNWMKACQSESQFRTFMRRTDRMPFPVDGGIVFFEEFCGDGWERRTNRRLLEGGWSEWYRGHSEVEGFRLDLLRLRAGNLEGFTEAFSAKIKSLPPEELSRLLASLATADG